MKENTKTGSPFPDGFYWGTASSGYQQDGYNSNDWSDWETSEKRLRELRRQGKNPADYICGRACDHYNRYGDDLKTLALAGHNAFRFSFEWSLFEPKEGEWNEEAIKHYHNYIDTMLELGLKPIPTLWHYTIPKWFRDIGGWRNPKAPRIFARYADFIAEEFSYASDIWLTLNEPNFYAAGFLSGWGPQDKDILAFIPVESNLILSHKLAYRAIKRQNSEAKISLAYNFLDIEPVNLPSVVSKAICPFLDWLLNFRFFSGLEKHLDFIGANYYSVLEVGIGKRKVQFQKSDMGWMIYPQGIYNVSKKLWNRYHLPIFVTENGITTTNDWLRQEFIKDHIRWFGKAGSEGVKIIGYLFWSWLDNFEWVEGWTKQFGLEKLNRETLEREPRPSFYDYSKIIRTSGSELFEQSRV